MASPTFLSIAYVTALLKSLIEHGLMRDQIADLVGGVVVSALSPEQLSAGADEQARLNMFLSHIAPNTRVRSLDPRAKSTDSSAVAPLAFDLHYVVTAYSAKELQSETLLGYASEFFRARPGLSYTERSWRVQGGAAAGETIAAPSVPGAPTELPGQISSLGIRPLFPSTDELSKMWSALQTKYRPSLSYRVEIQPESVGRPAALATIELQRAR